MNYDIYRNGSGYVDSTAYKAIKNYMRSEENKMELYKGDIIEFEQNNGNTKEAVVISVHENFSTILSLCENERLPYSVNCRGVKFTDPGMLQYMYNERAITLIRSMKQDEIDDLIQEVVIELGYEAPVKEIVNGVTHKPVDYIDKAQSIVETDELKADLTKAQAERDVYKSLYENLISGMMAK